MENLVWNTDMLASGLILFVTFVLIFTEGLHHIHRAKVALGGAAVMMVVGQLMGFYNPELALEAIDWNVVFLLGAMMTVIAIMVPTGGFQAIAFNIARLCGGNQVLLLSMLGAAVSGLSMLLDNVTTVVIFGPLIILIAQSMGVSPVPYLLAAAILSNTGGVATLVGDPPNLMIGSAASIDFTTFFIHMGGITLVAWLGTLAAVCFLFRKELAIRPDLSSMVQGEGVTDRYTWNCAIGVLVLMVIGFLFHGALHWEAWVVSGMGLTLLLLLVKHIELDEYFAKAELSLLVFFLALFVIIGGVEHSRFLEYVAQFIVPFVQEDLFVATLVLMWAAAILSAAIDNIPFTAAMIPILLGMEAQGVNVTPLWWALAAGAGLGGNGTHIGASANVFVVSISEKLARQTGRPELAITPGLWFRKGTPVMIFTLLICTAVFALFFEFYSTPLR
jgi:Na+/H+ antiporter NhaD and related arsenite permeases